MKKEYIHHEIYFTQQLARWEKQARKPIAADPHSEAIAGYYKTALRGLEALRKAEA